MEFLFVDAKFRSGDMHIHSWRVLHVRPVYERSIRLELNQTYSSLLSSSTMC